MKVMLDTNIYISSIRNGDHADIMQRRGTVKYIGGHGSHGALGGRENKRGKEISRTAFECLHPLGANHRTDFQALRNHRAYSGRSPVKIQDAYSESRIHKRPSHSIRGGVNWRGFIHGGFGAFSYHIRKNTVSKTRNCPSLQIVGQLKKRLSRQKSGPASKPMNSWTSPFKRSMRQCFAWPGGTFWNTSRWATGSAKSTIRPWPRRYIPEGPQGLLPRNPRSADRGNSGP